MTDPEPAMVVLVGGSAGSLPVLRGLLRALGADFPLPVACVLHLGVDAPSGHVAATLSDAEGGLPARVAHDKAPLEPGVAWLAPGGYHLLAEAGPRLALSLEPPVRYSRPSIDLLFESGAEVFRRGAHAVVLSGANDDGRRGAAAIARLGGAVVAQAPETAEVATMPRAVLAALPDARSLAPAELAAWLRRLATLVPDRPGH